MAKAKSVISYAEGEWKRAKGNQARLNVVAIARQAALADDDIEFATIAGNLVRAHAEFVRALQKRGNFKEMVE